MVPQGHLNKIAYHRLEYGQLHTGPVVLQCKYFTGPRSAPSLPPTVAQASLDTLQYKLYLREGLSRQERDLELTS